MKRGYHKKFTVKNQLYRRFTNRSKGYTPRAIDPKSSKVIGHTEGVYNDINRIYEMTCNVVQEGAYTPNDLIFNRYSYRNPEELISLASSLPSEDISLVYKEGTKLKYYYPFKNYGKLKFETKTYPIPEESVLYYPGFYFFNKTLYHTYTLSNSVFFYRQSSEDTPYYLGDGECAVYIPFDAIKTPIIQAYLPLSVGTQFTMTTDDTCRWIGGYSSGDRVDFPVKTSAETFYWMGKSIEFRHPALRDQSQTYLNYVIFYNEAFPQTEYLYTQARDYIYDSLYTTQPKFYIMFENIGIHVDVPYKGDTNQTTRMYGTTNYSNITTILGTYDSLKPIYGLDSSYSGQISIGSYYKLYYGYVDAYHTNLLKIGSYLCRRNNIDSYSGFNKKTRDAIRKLAIPVGEFFDLSSSV